MIKKGDIVKAVSQAPAHSVPAAPGGAVFEVADTVHPDYLMFKGWDGLWPTRCFEIKDPFRRIVRSVEKDGGINGLAPSDQARNPFKPGDTVRARNNHRAVPQGPVEVSGVSFDCLNFVEVAGLWPADNFVRAGAPSKPSPHPFKKGDTVVQAEHSEEPGLEGLLVVKDTISPLWLQFEGMDGIWEAGRFNFVGPPSTPSPDLSEHAKRKARPLFRGLVAYFPDALDQVAKAVLSGHSHSDAWVVDVAASWELLSRVHLALSLTRKLQAHLTGVSPTGESFLGSCAEALAEVAHVSVVGNEQHHPGAPLHWEKGKSTDHPDCLFRHLADHRAGRVKDSDGLYHLAKAVWRVFAWIQATIEDRNPVLAAAREAQRQAAALGK